MPNPHILKRPSIFIHKDLIQLIQRLQSLYNMPKHRVFPVQVPNLVCKGYEELAPTTSYRPILTVLNGGCDSHGDRSFVGVLEAGYKLGGEISLDGGIFGFIQKRPYGFSSSAGSCRIASLCEEVLRH